MQTVACRDGIGEVNDLLVAGLVVNVPVFLEKIHSDSACAALRDYSQAPALVINANMMLDWRCLWEE